jgi:hypothetical protein
MVTAMGTRSLLLCIALLGLTSTAPAQTSTFDDSSRIRTATVLQTSADIVQDKPVLLMPLLSIQAAVIAAADGGDGISDATDAGWISEPRQTRLQ